MLGELKKLARDFGRMQRFARELEDEYSAPEGTLVETAPGVWTSPRPLRRLPNSIGEVLADPEGFVETLEGIGERFKRAKGAACRKPR